LNVNPYNQTKHVRAWSVVAKSGVLERVCILMNENDVNSASRL